MLKSEIRLEMTIRFQEMVVEVAQARTNVARTAAIVGATVQNRPATRLVNAKPGC